MESAVDGNMECAVDGNMECAVDGNMECAVDGQHGVCCRWATWRVLEMGNKSQAGPADAQWC